MLKYPQVVTNIDFIKFLEMPLDIRSVIIVDSDTDTEDGAYFVYEVESFIMLVNLDAFRLCT